jgi:ubiquinol-cytochrome c reductase cytochrome b subunit
LLPFYAILRSIPNKLLGVIAMFAAILMLLVLPLVDMSKNKGLPFKPLTKVFFYIFIANFLILIQLGGKHVETPYIELGQLATLLYFMYFLFFIPLSTFYENSILNLSCNKLFKS